MNSIQLLKLLKSGSKVKFFNKTQHLNKNKFIQLLKSPLVIRYLKSEKFNNSIYTLLPKSIQHLPFLVKRYKKKSYAYYYLPSFVKNKNNVIIHNLKKDPLIYLDLNLQQKNNLSYIYICAQNFVNSYEKYKDDNDSISGVAYEEALFIEAIPKERLIFFNISFDEKNLHTVSFRQSYFILEMKEKILQKEKLEKNLSTSIVHKIQNKI